MKKLGLLILVLLFKGIWVFGQWQKLPEIYGGFIKDIQANSNTVFASSYYFLFKSTDYGNTWKKCVIDSSRNNIDCFAIENNSVYANTQLGLYFSNDNGESWKLITKKGIEYFAFPSTFVLKNGILYSGRETGVYCSKNQGKTWENTNSTFNKRIKTILFKDTVLFVSTIYDGVYKSLDYGKTWIDINNKPMYSHTTSLYKYNNTIFATGSSIFYTNDDGKNWSYVNYSIYIGVIVHICAIENNIFVSNSFNKVILSKDNGKTWNELSYKYLDKEVFKFFACDSFILAGTWGNGIIKSTDKGETWKISNTGIKDLLNSQISIKGNEFYASTQYGVLLKTNLNSIHWDIISKDNRQINELISSDKTVYFSTSYEFGISHDSGLTFSFFPYSMYEHYFNFHLIDNKLFATKANCIYNFDEQNNKWALTSCANDSIRFFYINGNNIYTLNYKNRLFSSNNNGVTWKDQGGPLKNERITNIVSLHDKLFIATYGNGIFYSRNNKNWINVNNGLGSLYIRDLQVFKNTIFATTTSGVYYSNDSGNNWKSLNDGLKDLNMAIITVSENYILTRTYDVGDIYYRTDINEITKNTSNLIFYPNPVKDNLNVNGLIFPANFTIYDISGRVVIKNDITGDQINVSSLKSGIYILKAVDRFGQIKYKFVKQ